MKRLQRKHQVSKSETLFPVLSLTYVSVADDQRSLQMFDLQLDQFIQRGRGHPGHPLATESQSLWARQLPHQLEGKCPFLYPKNANVVIFSLLNWIPYNQFWWEDQLLHRVQWQKLVFVKQLWCFLKNIQKISHYRSFSKRWGNGVLKIKRHYEFGSSRLTVCVGK